MLFVQNNTTKSSARSALRASETIMIHLRLNWSTRAPATGPSTIPGNKVSNETVARTVEDPVVCVIHQSTAKEANPLPNRDRAWVDQNFKKVNFHRFSLAMIS